MSAPEEFCLSRAIQMFALLLLLLLLCLFCCYFCPSLWSLPRLRLQQCSSPTSDCEVGRLCELGCGGLVPITAAWLL